MNRPIIILFLLFQLFANLAMAQQDSLIYEYVDEQGLTSKGLLIPGEALSTRMAKVLDTLYAEGYWTASIDSLYPAEAKAKVYRGIKYKEVKLSKGNMDSFLFDELKLFKVKEPKDWLFYGSKLRDYLGDLGYPFAQIQLDSIRQSDDNILAGIEIVKGPQIKYDSIYWEGDLELRPSYLMHYLGIESGAIYKHSDIINAENELKALPFVKLQSSPKLKFIGEYASLHMELDKQNASRLDFLVGVNPLNENNQTRFFITLDLVADLSNLLHFGEWIKFRFARLRPENQEIEFAVRYPYLFDMPIAVGGDFGIYRRSLDFQEIKANFGVDYLVSAKSSIGVGWTYLSSRLINIDSMAIINSKRLPANLDVVKNGLELNYNWENLNQRLNPSKGWAINFGIKASTKQIIENQAILELESDEVDFSMAYDSLSLNGFQLGLEANLNKYFPIRRNFALNTYLDAEWLISNINIYDNELARIGGNQRLRGFDEESILARAYVVPGVALHVLLDEYSFLSLPFVDYALIAMNDGTIEHALGVGAGINIRTRAGMLNFSIAAGKLGDGPFDVTRPKVHIGFLSLF